MSRIIFNPENAQWMVAQMALGTRVAGYVVNVNWNGDDREWNVNAWKLDDDNWNAGNRAFSRNSHGSPTPSVWEFSFQYLFATLQASCQSQRGVRTGKHISYYRGFEFPMRYGVGI